MDVKTIVLGLIFVIIYFTMIQSKNTYEPLEATCKNANVMNCSKICNKGSATLKCKTTIGNKNCEVINDIGCKGDKEGPTGVYDKCVDSTCKDEWFQNNLKNCARRHCASGCGEDYKKCVDEIIPASPKNSDKDTEKWIFQGANQNCSSTTTRNFVGYMNKKDGQFKDLVATCNNSPGCGYIVRDAKGGHGNLYKICETKANKGMDVWKRPGGPADIPPSHEIGGMITYAKMANKNTYTGAGSQTLDPSPWGMGVTVDQCKKFCDENDDCGCIVYEKKKEGAMCHLRKGPCDPKFFQNGTSSVYLKKPAAPMEQERPTNMLKVGEGACRFGGIPNKGYVGKGYMSPKECLEACSGNKNCYGADFNKIKKSGANCTNFINEKAPFNYNLWTAGGAAQSGYCYKKIPDGIKNCKVQAGKYGCEKCEDEYELSEDKKKCTYVEPIPNCNDQLGKECIQCTNGYEKAGPVDHPRLKHHRLLEGFIEGHTPSSANKGKEPICRKISKIENCETQKGSKCTACNKGFQLNLNNKCEKPGPAVPNCLQQSGDLCNSCESGFQLGGDKRSCVKGSGGSSLSAAPFGAAGGGAAGGGAHGAAGGGAHGAAGGAGGGAHGAPPGAHGAPPGAHGAHGGPVPAGAHGAHAAPSSSLPVGIPGSAAAAEAQVVDPTIGDEPEGIAPDAFEAGKNPEALAAAAANCDAKPKDPEDDIEGPACKKEAVARSVPFSEPTKEEEADPEAKADTVPDTRLDNLPPGTCSWQGCCSKDKPPLPALGLMRPHKHKHNPKMVTSLNNVNNYLQEWLEKVKPLPTKEQEEPDYKLIKEENAKLNEILARINAQEMRKKMKVKKKKKAFPIDLDVVLNDEINIENDLKKRFLKPNMFQYEKDNKLTASSLNKTAEKLDDLKIKMKEGFISGSLPVRREGMANFSNPGWGFGPRSVNKKKIINMR